MNLLLPFRHQMFPTILLGRWVSDILTPFLPIKSFFHVGSILRSGLIIFVMSSPLQAEMFYVANAPKDIQWHEWGPEAFRRAQAEDKLILLDLTAVWCHACHVMDQKTYGHPRIIDVLNQHFIPVRVDTDQRPDLENRYRAGGWPTTSLLLPTGEILFQANALEVSEMEEILTEVRSIYTTDKVALLKKASQFWDGIHDRIKSRSATPPLLQKSLVEQSIEIMRNQFDTVNGGFRDAPKFFEPQAVQLALSHGFFKNDAELIKMGVETLQKQARLLDPVWGGFYRYAEKADWSQPHYEKMLTIQAHNLRNYIDAFQLTGNAQFKRIAVAVVDYVSRFLTDPQTALFFESQDADVQNSNSGSFISGAKFFPMDDIQRQSIGVPRVDRRSFTGSNAMMASAYLHASPVLERPEMQELALQVLSQLFHDRFNPQKGLAHLTTEAEYTLYALLSDHIYLGHALVDAFSATGQIHFLHKAETLAEITQTLLEDSETGGFFDYPRTTDTLGLLKVPAKPITENLHAAYWYLKLFYLTEKPHYQAIAEKTLQGTISSFEPLPIALAGLVLDHWFRIPVHIAVLGTEGEPGFQGLALEARRVYCPGKLVKLIDPRREKPRWGDIVFPFNGRSVAFVCTDRICSAPVFERNKLKENIADLLAALHESQPQ